MRAKISQKLERLLADPVQRRAIIPAALGRKPSAGGFSVIVVGSSTSGKQQSGTKSVEKVRIGSNR